MNAVLSADLVAWPASYKALTDVTNDQPYLGGVSEKAVYEDPDGNRWLWKYGASEARKEVATTKLAELLGMVVCPAIVFKVGRRVGALLPMLKGVQQLNQTRKYKPEDWDKSWLAELFAQSVLEYLVGDADRHQGNYLVKGKVLVGIDHGYAFYPENFDKKHSAHDYLKYSYSQLDRAVRTAPVQLLRSITPASVADIFDRLDAIPDAEYASIIRYGVGRGRCSSSIFNVSMARKSRVRAEYKDILIQAINNAGPKAPRVWKQWLKTGATI